MEGYIKGYPGIQSPMFIYLWLPSKGHVIYQVYLANSPYGFTIRIMRKFEDVVTSYGRISNGFETRWLDFEGELID